MCHNPKCNCQKQITLTPKQFQLKGKGFKMTMRKVSQGAEKKWKKFLEPALNISSPFVGIAVSARAKHPQIGKATNDILKSISIGKTLCLTDLHGNGLRLRLM